MMIILVPVSVREKNSDGEKVSVTVLGWHYLSFMIWDVCLLAWLAMCSFVY